ncbi:MAG: hypothetical protein NT084_13145 [Bacteroidetes bacterium]|nr:hypothetical protein [Bacteroidota bacterium]
MDLFSMDLFSLFPLLNHENSYNRISSNENGFAKFPTFSFQMRIILFSLLLLFSFQVSAKKAPKWKDGDFKTTSSGLQYKIEKEGKGHSIGANDSVVVEYACYSKRDSKKQFSTKKLKEGKFYFDLGKNSIGVGFKESLQLLKQKGCGYFIIPQKDSSAFYGFYFFRIVKVIHKPVAISIDTFVKNDSINFSIADPNQKYFGDTLFSLMKLVEQPQITKCGSSKIIVAFKFEMTTYENGVVHKTMLVFIECPESFGKDFFIAGGNYMVTCVPLLDDLKNGSRTMNSYSLEKLDRYYGLRIRKM